MILRKAENKDLVKCVEVEKSAIKGFSYLGDVWDYFMSTKGELSCVEVDGDIRGIGKYTVLPDNTAWLETLRVDPDYQGRGIGKRIYERYFEQAREFGNSSMAMYTGINNVVSAGLAKRNGFEKVAEFRGYVLENFLPGEQYPFELTDPITAMNDIMPHKEKFGSHFVLNRTFYRFNEENISAMSMDSLVFKNSQTGSIVMCGARFQHLKAMHIGFMAGDMDECLEFIKRYAYSHKIPKIICTFPIPNKELEEFLADNNFVKEPSDLIVMEIKI